MQKEHNAFVKSEFQRARQGQAIDLTALMISKEKVMAKRGDFGKLTTFEKKRLGL